MKRCSKCAAVKVLSEFKTHAKNGTRPECRECTRAYNAKYREHNRQKIQAQQAAWYADNRERVLADQRERYPQQRTARIASSAAWYAANRERALAWCSDYKIRRFGISRDEFEQLMDSQGGVCAICAQPPTPRARLSIDHDHACCPARRGCRNCIRGLLCSPCNLHEDRADPDAWAEYLARPRPLNPDDKENDE